MFEECRLEGNVELTSGRVTKYYYDFDRLTPRQTREVALKLVHEMPIAFTKVNFIVAPALGGIVPAYMVGEWLDIPVVTVEKDGRCRGLQFPQGNSYIIVDDVVSSYGEVDRCIEIFSQYKHMGTMAYIYRGVEDMRSDTIVLDRKEPEYAEIQS
jgi:orotate phosphoribosyltransferase